MAKPKEMRESTSSSNNNVSNESPEAHPDHSSDTAPEDYPQKSSVTEWADRKSYGDAYWGKPHPVPEIGDPKRLNMFVKPQPMSSEEKARILAGYRKALVFNGDACVDEPSWTAPHLRPSTPRSKRAEKDLEMLKKMGEDVGPAAKASVYGHHQENLGLMDCLRQYYQEETYVEVKYVNELIRQVDQLKLEMATQLSCQERTYNAAIKDKDAEIKLLKDGLTAANRTARGAKDGDGNVSDPSSDSNDDDPENLPQYPDTAGLPSGYVSGTTTQAGSDSSEATPAQGHFEKVKLQLQQTQKELRQSKGDSTMFEGEMQILADQVDEMKASMIQTNEESKIMALAMKDMKRERAEERENLESSVGFYRQKYKSHKLKSHIKSQELQRVQAEVEELGAEREQLQDEGNRLRLELREARRETRAKTEEKQLLEFHLQLALEICHGPGERTRNS